MEYCMKRFVMFYLATVMFFDAIYMGVFVHIGFSALMLPALITYQWLYKSKTTKSKKKVIGLELGKGVDIGNPDTPITVDVVLEEKALGLGVLFVGSPGSGKSIAAIVLSEYYTKFRKIGWCYWEGKGDKDIYQKAISCGAAPDKFFSSDLEFSDSTNVVSGTTESILEALTQTLITSESDYYRNAQREALAAVIPLLKACNKPINLRDIYVALKVDQAAQYVINLAKKAGAAADVIEVARLFYDREPDDRAKDINGLMIKMSLFVTGFIADRLNAYEPSLDLVEASKKGERVYFHLPYSSMAKDIATMFTEQIGGIAKQRQLYDDVRTPWPQMFDDWGKFFYTNVGSITARCRSAGMPISYFFQSKGQIDAVENGIFTTEIMDNIGGFCSFRINGNDTAKWAAEQFGTYETSELNVSEHKESSGQVLTVNRIPRIEPDVLKDLNAGEAFISCLQSGEGGESNNKRYKARFPLPVFQNEKSIEWPIIETKTNNNCEGLHLWRDFMDKDRLKELKKEVVQQALDQEEADEIEEIDDNELEHEVDYL